MKKLRPTNLVRALMWVPDLVFTPTLIAGLAVMLGLELGPLALIASLVLVVRLGAAWLMARHWIGPADELQRRADSGRPVSADALLDADGRLRAAPTELALLFSVVWALQIPVIVGLYHLTQGMPALPSGEGNVVGTFTASLAIAAYGGTAPLFAWQLSDLAGRHHLLALELGVDLERPPRSLPRRLTRLGLLLVLSPTLVQMASSRASLGWSDHHAAALQAQAIAGELTRSPAAGLHDSLARLGRDLDPTRATAFVLEPGHDPKVVGRALPSWATAPLLGAAVDGERALPDRAMALGVRRRPDGTLVGGLVRTADSDKNLAFLALTTLLPIIILAVLSAWLVSRSISVPLERAAAATRRVVEVGDLSRMGALPIAEVDEIGVVTQNLNELFTNTREVAKAAGRVADGRLEVELGGVGELADAFRQMLLRLRAVVQEMHSTATELAAAATEITAATQEQEAASTSHSAGMSEITQTMDSLSQSAAHVAAAVAGVLDNAERTLGNTDQMVVRINELTGHANRIADILEVIRDIADRTDLLALNGSLEATRAGEAGLGFSLVASEMRRLAERVTASVVDIKALVGDIRESGASTVVATEESKKLAEGTTRAARSITLVSQQQQTSTEQVTQNVRAVAEVVQQAAAATTQTRTSAERLKAHADRLAELVRTFHLGG